MPIRRIEIMTFNVTSAGQSATLEFKCDARHKKFLGVGCNFNSGRSFDINDFQVKSQSVLFASGTPSDIITVRDHLPMNERFFPVDFDGKGITVQQDDKVSVSVRDTSSTFLGYSIKIFLLFEYEQTV